MSEGTTQNTFASQVPQVMHTAMPASAEVFSAPKAEQPKHVSFPTAEHDEQVNAAESKHAGKAMLRIVSTEGFDKGFDRLAAGDIEKGEIQEERFGKTQTDTAKQARTPEEKTPDVQALQREALLATVQQEVARLSAENQTLRRDFEAMRGQLQQTQEVTRKMVEALIALMKMQAEKAKTEEEKKTLFEIFTELTAALLELLTIEPVNVNASKQAA